MRGIFATEKEKQRRTKKLQRIVYLIGAGPGAGVTHTGILLAEYLEERRGARTLFLEANNHKDVGYIRKELLSADYESLGERTLGELKLQAYDYIIADLGTDLSFRRIGQDKGMLGVLVGNGASWRRERFCQAVKGLKKARTEMGWTGLLSLGDRQEALQLSGQLKFQVEALGWQPLYKPLSEQCEELFLSLIRGGRSK